MDYKEIKQNTSFLENQSLVYPVLFFWEKNESKCTENPRNDNSFYSVLRPNIIIRTNIMDSLSSHKIK